MAGVGTKITATDYNAIQTKISDVMATGTGTYGYGQTINSAQVAALASVTVAQWNNLRADLLRARQHQTGADESANLTTISTSVKITEVIRSQFNTYADTIQTNRTIIPPTGQGTRTSLSSMTYATAWRTSITHTITATFASTEQARFYFNAGGVFEFTAGLPTDGTTNTKNSSWTILLTNMQTIKFTLASTTVTGSGTGSAIGYSSLTSTNQLIFQKNTEAPTYNPNSYTINARTGTSAAQIIFTILFNDASAPAGLGVDENVTGTITSTVQVYYATGSNVSVTAPTATGTFV